MYSPRNSNLAYDFDMFDTEMIDTRRKEKEKNKIKLSIAKNVAARNGNFIKILIIASCSVAIPWAITMCKAQVSEISTKINQEMVMLEEAKRENERLRSDLDNLYTLNKVEEYAVSELGLEKIKSTQEAHVILNTGNLTEVVAESYDNPIVAVKDRFNNILEYLGFH